MEPLRECQSASHFVKNDVGKYLPCEADTPGAEAKTLMEVAESLEVPPMSMKHFRNVLAGRDASTGAELVAKFEEWSPE